MDKTTDPIKKEIGRRFKLFREAIGKTQTQLADELDVYQSTITNIEVGKTFPNLRYLQYFHRKYMLNTNWLLSNRGDIFIPEDEPPSTASSILNYHLGRSELMFRRYTELMELMQVPVVEQIILAKLTEVKVIAGEEINHFKQKEKKAEKTEKNEDSS